jgi:DinB family protein
MFMDGTSRNQQETRQSDYLARHMAAAVFITDLQGGVHVCRLAAQPSAECARPKTGMNPYARFLAGHDPMVVLASTSLRLEEVTRQLHPSDAEQPPAPGKWSARDIMCHLADTEVVFAFRLRQALAETHHTIQPYDQNLWAKQYDGYQIGPALDVFATVRNWNLTLLRATKDDDLARPVTHPERGTMTFQTLVETMAGHDLNHLRQLDAIASAHRL